MEIEMERNAFGRAHVEITKNEGDFGRKKIH
jgi:hypothetical protein